MTNPKPPQPDAPPTGSQGNQTELARPETDQERQVKAQTQRFGDYFLDMISKTMSEFAESSQLHSLTQSAVNPAHHATLLQQRLHHNLQNIVIKLPDLTIQTKQVNVNACAQHQNQNVLAFEWIAGLGRSDKNIRAVSQVLDCPVVQVRV